MRNQPNNLFAQSGLLLQLLILSVLLSGGMFVKPAKLYAEGKLAKNSPALLVAARDKDRKRKKPQNKQKPKPQEEVPASATRTRERVIAKVDPERVEDMLQSAAKIDQLVEENYKKCNVTPNDELEEGLFLRRVFLDVTGTLPTYEQTDSYLKSEDPEKRRKVIDYVLNSPGYASHSFNYFGDILRFKNRLTNNFEGLAYFEWFKKSLEENKPYDEMVYEMINSSGTIWESPAIGYLVRDNNMPLDNMSNTVRTFLGTQIGCAKCHDHPFEKWTQKEFYELAAFTFGTQTKVGFGNKKVFGTKNPVKRLKDELRKIDPKFNDGRYNTLFEMNSYIVKDNTSRRLRLPRDYAYDNAKPNQTMFPKVIFGHPVSITADQTPREAFADWLTSPENPRFATVIANRLWKRLFGIGQIEPVDDMTERTEAENPELMKYLTAEMVRLEFDMKEYLRILLNTRAYQRQATFEQVAPGDDYHFPGPVLRRMTAEQLWDSFVTIATYEPDEYQTFPAIVEQEIKKMDVRTITAQEAFERRKLLDAELGGKAKYSRTKPHRYKNLILVRASELPIPAPPGHFLRQFGQSDREVIEGSSTDGTVPQALQMYNGNMTHMLLEKGTRLHSLVVNSRTDDERLKAIFYTLLCRKPTSDDRRIARKEVKRHGNTGFGNVIWALVNTREFMFIQ